MLGDWFGCKQMPRHQNYYLCVNVGTNLKFCSLYRPDLINFQIIFNFDAPIFKSLIYNRFLAIHSLYFTVLGNECHPNKNSSRNQTKYMIHPLYY